MKKQLLYILGILLTLQVGVSTQIKAATKTWLGSVNSSYFTSGNWNSGVPDSTDNIIVNSNAPYNLTLTQNHKVASFTINGDTLDLGGYTLTITGTCTFNGGKTTTGIIKPIGTLCHFGGGIIDSRIEANCGYYHMNGSSFLKTTILVSTGSASSSGTGNCTFSDSLTITHSGVYYFTMGSTNGDNFQNVTITNNSTHEFYLGTADSTFISGNLILNNTSSGGIVTGNTGGVTYLASGKTISIGSSGFSNNYLTLKNFYQQGSTAQTLTLTGTAILNLINANFDGNLTVTSPGILLKNSTFNGTTTITRNGSSGNYHCEGNNIFSGPLSIDNAASAGRIRMASTTPDTYLDNVTLSSSGGMDLQIAYSGENFFHGNVTINSNKVVFNTASGKVTFSGDSIQTLNGSYNYPFKKLAINKTGGFVTSNATFSVDDTLFLIKGTFLTKSSNELIFKLGSKVVGASDSSYVEGPVKKIGNTGFVFPTGDNTSYRPIEISAPSTTTSEFIAEFKDDSLSVNTNTKDTTLARLLRKQYWNLNRTSGTSQVYVTLGWNSFSSIADTLITIASWNGSQWKDLGKGLLSGNVTSGNLKSNVVATSYSQFIIAFSGSSGVIMPPECYEVANANDLKNCLLHSGVAVVVNSFDLNGLATTDFPLVVPEGVLLSSSFKWWEPECLTITSNHKAVYDPNNISSMFVFAMQPNSTIQNLRIRGAHCNYKDFNESEILCGGIYVDGSNGSLAANIFNCEISCFSQAGIWKNDVTPNLNIENCYLHKVKGRSATGIGYGVWTQSLYTSSTPQIINFRNDIFDDCKAAIDGQAKIISWYIDKCTLTQFFISEDINSHNDNRFELKACPCSTAASTNAHYLNHWTFSNNNNSDFYGKFWDNTISCTRNCPPNDGDLGFSSDPWHNFGNLNVVDISFYSLVANQIPIHDVGGSVTSIQNSIFHKKWGIGVNGNINLSYPNLDNARDGDGSNNVNISNNTFATDKFDKDVVLTTKENNAGYTKIANNYIEADIWADDGDHIKFDGNSFSYQLGTSVVSTASQPHELALELNDGTNVLPTGYSLSPFSGHKQIQYVDVNTAFNIEAYITNVGGSAESYYIIRPNPNTNGVSTTSEAHVISNENYFFDSEEKLNGTTVTKSITYNKPGLYGIDVMGFDAHYYGTIDKYNFRATSWQHIPVIVKDDSEEQVLYFNVKDSYQETGTALTGVMKQAYLNDVAIWSEEITDGGAGWEAVQADLKVNSIKTLLHTDGTPNVLSFGIFMSSNIDASLLKGLYVWVDDVYIKKSGSPTGDNLIKDGSIERILQEGILETGISENRLWFQDISKTFSGCNETTDGGISSQERKSGEYAIQLEIEPLPSCTSYVVAGSGETVVSVGTTIDFTDLLSCDDYWNGTSSVLGFEEFPGFSSISSGKKYYVDTNLEINDTESWTIEGCEIVFVPGKKITIKDGGSLTILIDGTTTPKKKSHLFSCDEIWQGIVINDGGALTINGVVSGSNTQNCTISNAISAVKLPGIGSGTGSPIIDINTTAFSNNLISIDAKNCDLSSSLIRGCKFYLLNEFITQSPNQGVYPEYHLNFDNVSNLTIGTGGGTNLVNIFSGVKIGINAINSNMTISNSEFNNLINYSVTPHQKGIGIISENTTSTPCTLDVDSRFDMLHTGILTSGNINVNIHGSTGYFRDIDDRGISINSLNYNNDIVVNGIGSFQNNNIAIRIFGSNLNSVIVSNNTFTNSDFVETSTASFHNTAITIQSPVNASRPNTVAEVFGNNITDYRIGIHASNVPNISIGSKPALVAPNQIFFDQDAFNDFHHAIWLEGCDGAKVQDNEITQISAAIPSGSYSVEGITINECQNGFINVNDINELHTPIHVIGTCDDTELHCNDIINNTNSGAGVFMTLGKLPEQGDYVGKISWDNTWEGYGGLTYGVTGTAITQFLWPWDDIDQTFNPNADPNLIGSPAMTTPTKFGCALATAPDDPDRDLRYGPIAEDTLSFADFEQEFTYKSKLYLFNLIQADSTLLIKYTSKDTLFSNFNINITQTNIGKFYKVDSLILVGDLATAETLNSSITDTNQIETNLKTVNGLLINKVLKDSILNNNDTLTLEEIAWQNPITGGKAVFMARALLFLEIHSENYASRMGLVNITSAIDENIVLNHFTLAPNPANSLCSVYFDNMKSDFILSVKNMLSQTLFETKLSANTQTLVIPINSFEEGIYIVTINDNITTHEMKKLIIVR